MQDFNTRYTRYLVTMIMYCLRSNADLRDEVFLDDAQAEKFEEGLLTLCIDTLERVFEVSAETNQRLINGATS